jgi:hypothetical protein
MNFARWSNLLCLAALAAVLAASCTSTHDTADVVPSLPGAFQPDAGGKLIAETTACSELTKAESAARAALGCDMVTRDCPSYIRPAGGADCFVYDQASVNGCENLYQSFTTCDEFDQRPCLVTAVSQCDGTNSGSGGAGGQSGGETAGQAGTAGEAGAAGASTGGARSN